MTTDDKTPDPTPAILPPARLAAARSALDAFEGAPMGSTLQDDAAYDAARMLGPVLAHLDALTPRAPVDGEVMPTDLTLLSTDAVDPLYRLRVEVEHPDEPAGLRGLVTILGEELTSRSPTAQVTRVRNAIDLTPDEAAWLHGALGRVVLPAPASDAGRRLYYALHPTAHERAWESHDADLRARYDAQAATLVAAGRSEGEAERARLADDLAGEASRTQRALDRWNADVERHRATIARLTAELAAEREAHRVASAALHDRTAELAEARAALAESEAHADGMLTLCNVRTAELAAWRSATGADSVDAYDTWRAEHVDRVAAARLDGAREEREHLAAELSIEFERLSRVEHDRGERFAPGDAEGDAHDAARDAYNEAAKIVRARGQEQRS